MGKEPDESETDNSGSSQPMILGSHIKDIVRMVVRMLHQPMHAGITLGSTIIYFSVVFFLALILAGLHYRDVRSTNYSEYQEVSIPATSLVGGAELIGPGQWLSIARYGKDGTPSAEEWRMVGRVSAVSGSDTEKKVIVLAVPTHQAPTLQAALAAKDGPLLVHGPGQTPTATSTATPTATPAAGPR